MNEQVRIRIFLILAGFRTIVYSLSLGCAVDWMHISILNKEAPLYARVNHAYLFQNIGDEFRDKCLTFLDCSSYMNFAICVGFGKSIDDLSNKEWGVPPDPIDDLPAYQQYLSSMVFKI